MAASKKAAQPVIPRDLEKDIGAAKVLKAHLVEILGEDNADADTVRDAIEGETDLFETINAVVGQIGLDEAAVEGIEKFASTLAARKARLNKRSELLRVTLLNALDTIGDKDHKVELASVIRSITDRAMAALTNGKIDATVGTITMKDTAPKLVILNEAEIPSAFWSTPAPELDKRPLTDALKEHRDTLAQKLAELDQRRDAEGMSEQIYSDLRERVIAAFPAIPGAELSNGGATIQMRFS